MTPRWLPCRDIVEMVTDYLEGALPPDEVEVVEYHLSLCPPCQVYVEQMRVTIATLGYVPEDSLPDEAYDVLLEAFRGGSSSANRSL